MDHQLQTEGFGVRLRPVRLEDAGFIVWLRNLDHVKGRVGDSALGIPQQQAWLQTYFKRPGDYYFLVETLGGIPVGTYGLYDVREASGESGRFIMRPEVPAAVPTAVVGLDLAFGPMGLSALRGHTVSTNHKVLSLNRKFGFRQVGIKPAAQQIDGRPVDLVAFILEAGDWSKVRQELLPMARLAGNQVRQWERTQPAQGNGFFAYEPCKI